MKCVVVKYHHGGYSAGEGYFCTDSLLYPVREFLRLYKIYRVEGELGGADVYAHPRFCERPEEDPEYWKETCDYYVEPRLGPSHRVYRAGIEVVGTFDCFEDGIEHIHHGWVRRQSHYDLKELTASDCGLPEEN